MKKARSGLASCLSQGVLIAAPKGGNGDSPAETEACDRAFDTSEKICRTQAKTIEGLAAQISWFNETFAEYFNNNASGEIKNPFAAILAGATALAENSTKIVENIAEPLSLEKLTFRELLAAHDCLYDLCGKSDADDFGKFSYSLYSAALEEIVSRPAKSPDDILVKICAALSPDSEAQSVGHDDLISQSRKLLGGAQV